MLLSPPTTPPGGRCSIFPLNPRQRWLLSSHLLDLLLPGAQVCFTLTSFWLHNQCLPSCPRVCGCACTSPIPWQRSLCLAATWLLRSRELPLAPPPHVVHSRPVFSFLRLTFGSGHPVSCPFLALPSPSLSILSACQGPARLEATPPDPGSQLPCDKHH